MKSGVAICLVLGLFASCGTVLAQDCKHMHTRLERTVCSSPQLQELDREMRRLGRLVLSRQLSSAAEVALLRDRTARRCRYAKDQPECLSRNQLAAIATLAEALGELVEVPASYLPHARLQEESAAKDLPAAAGTADGPDNGEGADRLLQEHGDLALLETYRQRAREAPDAETSRRIFALRQSIRSGCDDPQQAAQWRQRLSWYGLDCRRL